MGYDLTIKGRITDIKRTSGTRNDGSTWEKTSFKVLRPKKNRGNEVYEESFYLSIWEDLQLVDGDVYAIYGDIARKKDENGNYNWDVLPRIVMPVGELPIPQKAKAPQQQKQNAPAPAPKPQPTQQRGFSNPSPTYGPNGSNRTQNGPESFQDDGIPF